MTIVARDLVRRFGPQQAVASVSFTAGRGEVLGLLGPNGAGKTTTMRMLVTALQPSAGTAEVAGFDVRTAPLQVRQRVGYLPEDVALPGEARVCEVVRFVAEVRGLRRAERTARAGALLERVGLDGSQRRRIAALSRGQRQRLGLALALLGDPPVVILDEPTAGLDPEQIVVVRMLIRELGETKTVLLSSHQLAEVELLCQRVAVLRSGRLIVVEQRDELARRMRTLPRILVRVAGPAGQWLDTLARVHPVEDLEQHDDSVTLRLRADSKVAPELARTVVEAGGRLLELRIEQPTLEDLFLLLAGESTDG